MRRLIASLLAFTFIFAIASCGNRTEPEVRINEKRDRQENSIRYGIG